MSEPFDAYHQWLGIPPADQPPHHYRLLGLALFESDPNVIANAADRQMAHLRSFATGKHSSHSQRLLNEVAAAKIALLKREKKAAYDAALQNRIKDSPPPVHASAQSTTPPPPLPAASAHVPRTAGAGAPQISAGAGRSVAAQMARRSSSAMLWLSLAALVLVSAIAGVVIWQLNKDSEQKQLAGNDSSQPAVKRDGSSRSSDDATGRLPASKTGEAAVFERSKTTTAKNVGEVNEDSSAGKTNPDSSESTPASEQIPPPTVQPDKAKAKPRAAPRRGVRAGTPNKAKLPPAATNDNASETYPAPTPNDAPTPPRKARSPVLSVSKQPVPGANEQQAAEKHVRELFAEEFAAAKKTAPKKTAGTSPLAGVLLQRTSLTSGDATATYVLLNLAREAAMDAGDAQLALRALDRLAAEYEIDATAERIATLNKLATTATQVSALRTTYENAWQTAVGLAQDDQYDEAAKALKLAQTVATRAKENEFARQTAQRIKDLATLAREYNVAKASLEKLAADADDPDANLAVARWYWFGKGRFDKAVNHLAKGSDAELKSAAESDLAAPTDTKQQIAVANLWMSAAEKRKADEKNSLEARAFYWYLKASAGAAALDDKLTLEKRIEEIRGRIEKRLLADAAKPATTEGSNAAGFLMPGLVIEYFADPQLQNRLGAATSNTLRSEYTHERELGLPPAGRFSARWTGWIAPAKSGPYKVRINTTGAFWLDGKPLIGPRTNPPEAIIELSARPHHIRYEMPDIVLGSGALFYFHAAGDPPQSPPADALYHIPLPGEAPVELRRTQVNPARQENL
jgi:hypothetical protein